MRAKTKHAKHAKRAKHTKYKPEEEKRWHCHGWDGDGDEVSFHYEDIVSEKNQPYQRTRPTESLGLYSIRISQNKFETQYPNIPLAKNLTNSQMLKVLKHSIAVSNGKRTETRFGPGLSDVGITTSWGDKGKETKKTLDELTAKIYTLHLKEIRRIKRNLQKSITEKEIDV